MGRVLTTALLLATFAALGADAPAPPITLPMAPVPTAVGTKMPARLRVANDEGAIAPLGSYFPQGKWVLLLFLGAQDPVTHGYAKRIHELAETYSKKGVWIAGLSVNQQEKLAELKSLAEESEWPFPVYRDLEQNAARALKVNETPIAVLIDPGNVVRYSGAIDDSWSDERLVNDPTLKRALDAALSGATIPEAPDVVPGSAIH
ncbi:MAG: redoxin domain-containing protein [Verrucomicrobiae bacterium]|nr:redoxin domain-containing protein [Verrucomicrobiae bacterium]